MVTLISVEEIQNNSKKYDIETECHNYYANGILVHNCSIALEYENGKLVKGITRGDGEQGDLITDNVMKMRGVQKQLKDKFTGTIRGEVLLYRSVREKYFPEYKNCRNGASGIMKHLDGKDCDKLNVKVYEARHQGARFATQVDMLDWMKSQGLDIVNYKIRSLEGLNGQQAIDIMGQVWKEDRDYDIDGIVWKTSSIDYEDLETNYRPEFAIALKPKYEIAETEIIDIEWSIKNGTFTPVCITKPVEIAGAQVRRASLCNVSLMEDLGIEIGHKIKLTRSGQIIPCVLADITTGKSRSGYIF